MVVIESQVPIGSSASLAWAEADGATYAPCVDGTDWIGIYCGDEPSAIADENPDSWQYVTISSGACSSGEGSAQWSIGSDQTTGDVCEFRLFDHEDGTSYYKIGTSNTFAVSGEADAYDYAMELSTTTINSGDDVTLDWSLNVSSSYTPCESGTDWVAYYCGNRVASVSDSAYLDYAYVSDVTSNACKTGSGEETLSLSSGRLPECQFRMFSSDGYTKVGQSAIITIADVASAVSMVHIALTADPSEMRVHFTAGTKTAPAVAYGASKGALTKSAEASCITYTADEMCQAPATSSANFLDPGWLCEAVLTGLEPDATVYYAATSDGVDYSTTQSFMAAPPSNDPDYAFQFVVYADMGTYSGSAAVTTAAISEAEVTTNNARMVHHIGDISYARGYAVTWEAWFDLISPYSGLAPYMIGIGNHEYDHTSGGAGKDPSGIDTDGSFSPSWGNFGDDGGGECGVPMDRRFTMPSNGNGIFWYEFSFANTHTIMLSSEHDCSEGSDQYVWLEAALKAVDRSVTPWLLVEFHRPMYNNEAYLGDYDVAVGMQAEFEELLVEYKVDLVLAGHYHSYLRSSRIYKDKTDETNGIYHYTIGSAGASLDTATLYPKDWVEYFSEEWGIGRITVANRTHMKWEFMQNTKEDAVVDSAWITNKIYG